MVSGVAFWACLLHTDLVSLSILAVIRNITGKSTAFVNCATFPFLLVVIAFAILLAVALQMTTFLRP